MSFPSACIVVVNLGMSRLCAWVANHSQALAKIANVMSL
jgi:hypothetical protein